MGWSKAPRIALLAVALAACSSDRGEEPTGGGPGGLDAADSPTDDTGTVRLDVEGGSAEGQSGEGGPTECDQDVDIVFVMDVSTSMGPFLTKLADEILVVDTALNNFNLPSPPQYGLVVFVDDTMVLNMGGPYQDATQLQADFQMWSAFTASNQQVAGGNLNTTWPENSLDALFLAAAGYQWRPPEDTLRLIIHTTDDTFWEGPALQNGVNIEHTYDETVAQLQSQEIRVFSFAAMIGGECECLDVAPGWFGPYLGKSAIPEATDGGISQIEMVLANQISLADAIPEAVEDKMCEPYPPQG